jgi:DNA-binding response OmpR family regulator
MDVRILIAEDEAIIALYIGMTLREAGHQVMGSVVRLDDCLPLVERTVPELALVDINLDRGGSGIDVARTLLERWGVMSIFVSAQYLQARENMDVAIGCLRKPFATRSLVESIEVAKLIQQGAMPLSIPQGLELFVKGAGRYLH